MKIDKKNLIIIVLSIVLAITLIYFVGFRELEKYCDNCKQKGLENSLQGIINEIKKRGVGIEITVKEDKLICDIRK